MVAGASRAEMGLALDKAASHVYGDSPMHTARDVITTMRRPTRRLLATPALAILLALVVLPLLIEGASLTHVHRAREAGIFNEEHVLAGAAAVKADAPLSVIPLIAAPRATATAPPAFAPVLGKFRSLSHPDPRAPPTL